MSQQPYYQQQPSPMPRNSGLAVASLILSILGLIGILPFLGSVVGLILGYSARNEIDRSGGVITGRGMAQWGIILGWVGLGLILLAICLVVTGVLTIPGLALCSGLLESTSY
ncbi:MAG: DUF4190 domain-containing protein [Anaerolineae bacterium]